MVRARRQPSVSVIVITRDEAVDLPACLASVSWANEVVVVDHGSVDGTPELARRAGASVLETEDWPGFGAQKQRALELAAAIARERYLRFRELERLYTMNGD